MLDSRYVPLFIVGFLLYIGFMIAVGILSTRGKTGGSNFLTGGSNLGFFLIFCTVGATMIGTGSSMGAIGNGFNHGWGGAIYGLGASTGILSMLMFVNIREKNFITMSEEAQYYYGGKKIVRQVMGFMMFVIEIIWLGNHMNGGSKYLAYITGLDDVLCKLITVLAFAVYVFIGGYLAVVVTDAVQFCVIIAGFALIAVRAIPAAGGYAKIAETFDAAGKSGAMGFYGIGSYGMMAAFALVLSTYMGVIGTPTHRTRIYTSADKGTAKKAFLSSGIMLFFWSFVTAVIGMSAFAIATEQGVTLESADYAFSFMATHVLGPVFGLVLMIAGLSATMSSGDSDAISGITILLTDVYPSVTGKKIKEEDYPKYSRIALVVTLAIAFLITLFVNDVITYIQKVVGSLLPGVAVCMFMGRFWKRATWQGGLACIFSGTVFGILYLLLPSVSGWVDANLGGAAVPATIITLIFGVIVSLVTPADTTPEADRVKAVFDARLGE
ncbi:MAG: sodium:solute symporter family protein [Lachnospiraceae bacterium]|mgnify:CR=1 FL=1|jgi:SSS family solute:Na+ symporter|nr:sodium:solute symporter family protein [Lachnospiraceae bacterium]